MPSPFPGMDPYLEQPAFWSSFHQRLLVAIATNIAPRLRPNYYAEVETRTYLDDADESVLVGIPDALVMRSTRTEAVPPTAETTGTQTIPMRVQIPMPQEVKERYLEVREVGTDAVIAVIEVLSPTNKRAGEGRTLYEKKRRMVLNSLSHLIEIDLLRAGTPMTVLGGIATQYRVLVSRSSARPMADCYGFNLADTLPTFLLPLKSPDADLSVDFQTIFTELYDLASYDLRIDYTQPVPPPALSGTDQQWVDALLAPFKAHS